MEKIRIRAETVVQDSATARALTPFYYQFCKRPCFHDDFLASFNRSSVTLVHTDGQGVERISPKGVVANGVEYEVDCIIMATGFEVGGLFSHSRPSASHFDIIGLDGQSLQQKWSSQSYRYGAGPRTYRSYHSAGFPNLCMQNAPQGAFTTNFTYALDESSKHFAHMIMEMRNRGLTKFDVKPQVEEAYLDKVWASAPTASGKVSNCTPGYYNNEGHVAAAGTKTLYGGFPGAPARLFTETAKERAEGRALDGFILS